MRIVTALLLLCLCLPVAAADSSDRSYWMDVTGSIEVDAEGRVSQYFLDKRQDDAIEKALVRDLVQWRFLPVVVNGQPTGGKTSMRILLHARPISDSEFQVRIVQAKFGVPVRKMHKDVKPPTYPFPALNARVQARVVIVAQLDADGAVERTHVEQVSLDRVARNEKVAFRLRRLFERSATVAAMKWTFNINEFAAGEPVGVTVRVPVEYNLIEEGGNGDDNLWRGFVAGPYFPLPWPSRGHVVAQQGDDSLKDGDVQPLDSLFRPAEPIIGRVL